MRHQDITHLPPPPPGAIYSDPPNRKEQWSN